MAISTRLSPIVMLQDNIGVSANGATLDITDATSAVIELTGSMTGLAAIFEASIDSGVTWFTVSMAILDSVPTMQRISSATAKGLYFLEYARPLNMLRARVVVTTPGGRCTARARSALA
jgi:hypothetical protein